MRILIIRHAEPDYAKDSLTEKGWREAEFLADKLEHEKIDACYLSPLGRAQDTAKVTLRRTGQKAKTLGWLREFHAPVYDKITKKVHGPWDLMPSFYTPQDDLYDINKWADTQYMRSGVRVKAEYNRVCKGLDKVLASHGYERKGKYYKAVNPNMEPRSAKKALRCFAAARSGTFPTCTQKASRRRLRRGFAKCMQTKTNGIKIRINKTPETSCFGGFIFCSFLLDFCYFK